MGSGISRTPVSLPCSLPHPFFRSRPERRQPCAKQEIEVLEDTGEVKGPRYQVHADIGR
jgi:hypothetical protein